MGCCDGNYAKIADVLATKDLGIEDKFLSAGLEAKMAHSLTEYTANKPYEIPTIRKAEEEFDKLYFGTVLGAGLAYGNKRSLAQYSGLGESTVMRRQNQFMESYGVDFGWFYPGKKPGHEECYKPDLLIKPEIGVDSMNSLPKRAVLDNYLENLYKEGQRDIITAHEALEVMQSEIDGIDILTEPVKNKIAGRLSDLTAEIVDELKSANLRGVDGYHDLRNFFYDIAYEKVPIHDFSYSRAKNEFMSRYVDNLLNRTQNIEEAAKMAGLSKDGLRRRIRQYNIKGFEDAKKDQEQVTIHHGDMQGENSQTTGEVRDLWMNHGKNFLDIPKDGKGKAWKKAA